MKRALKMMAYVSVLSLATIVVFAGPCEEGCEIQNTQCTNQNESNYQECTANIETENQQCWDAAVINYQNCVQNAQSLQETGQCNAMYQMDEYNCMNNHSAGHAYCDQNYQMNQTDCANSYDNCLFACGTNP